MNRTSTSKPLMHDGHNLNDPVACVVCLRQENVRYRQALEEIKHAMGSIGDEDGNAHLWHFEAACGHARETAKRALEGN